MRRMLARILVPFLMLVAPLAAANPDGDETVVIGTISYRNAVSFPNGAKVVLLLVDMSRPMNAAAVVSELTILHPKPVAWPYQLPYPGKAIDPESEYGVHARVIVGSEVWFATMQAAPVITKGNPSNRDLLLEPLARRAAAQ